MVGFTIFCFSELEPTRKSRAFPFRGDRSARFREVGTAPHLVKTSQTSCSMYSLNSLRMPSMSSAVLSSANVHDLQALAGGSPWWANTVHHVITSPSHRTSVLVWMLIEWQMPTLLLYTASCTRRMRVTAFFTSRVIALDFLRWAGLASPTC